MNIELPKNEDVIIARQSDVIVQNRGSASNIQRCYVSAGSVVAWLLFALLGLNLWVLRLLDIYRLPF